MRYQIGLMHNPQMVEWIGCNVEDTPEEIGYILLTAYSTLGKVQKLVGLGKIEKLKPNLEEIEALETSEGEARPINYCTYEKFFAPSDYKWLTRYLFTPTGWTYSIHGCEPKPLLDRVVKTETTTSKVNWIRFLLERAALKPTEPVAEKFAVQLEDKETHEIKYTYDPARNRATITVET
jgi:hypothetical protein